MKTLQDNIAKKQGTLNVAATRRQIPQQDETHGKDRYVNEKSSGEEHGIPSEQQLTNYRQIGGIDNEQEAIAKEADVNEISGRSIGKNEITLLPREQFNGHIVVVDKIATLDNALKCLNNAKFVGFDTETKPNFSKKQHHKVALMQLATDHTCYLLRLNRLGGIPTNLEKFLLNNSVMKIGLSLVDDFNAIKKYTNIIPANFVDLQKIVPDFGIQDASLQKIYAILFGKKISKRARLSNWESDILTENMQRYAALDAWACLKIYQQLVIRNNDK
jgi:hypothetical protein